MTDQQRELLSQCWKGMKCVVCEFDIDQTELNEIEETPTGYAHEHCLRAEEERESGNNNTNLGI